MPSRGIGERGWVRVTLVGAAALILLLLVALPLLVVLREALRGGLAGYAAAITAPETWSAIRLTLIVAAIVVPVNTAFGLVAAWCLARYRFRGRAILMTLIVLPFSVSPVVAGLVWVLLFGLQGWFGPWLKAHDIAIIFALPGILLATLFVTISYVARQVIPVMQAQDDQEELAALSLGASGWQIFRRITLPRIQWGLLNGVLLCNARTMGEFGAVSVVSGHITGLTMTMPLQVEVLYNEYNLPAAFAVASLLAGLAVLTLAAKAIIEHRERLIRRAAAKAIPMFPGGSPAPLR